MHVCQSELQKKKGWITHLRQLAGNMPGSMHVVLNSEGATLCLEGFCNKAKLLLRQTVAQSSGWFQMPVCRVREEKVLARQSALGGSRK